MPFIESCVVLRHNIWLVAAAAGVCALGCWVLVQLVDRAKESEGEQRLGWLMLATTSAGASIWCTHFVAILAYQPGAPVGFDPFLTVASALVATVGAGGAFLVALTGRWRGRAALGGALLGAATSAMHYTGMLAYRVEGIVSWSLPTLVASLVPAVAFAAAGLHTLVHGRPARRKPLAVASLAAAIVGLHFTGMAALRIKPLLIEAPAANREAFAALALAVVGMTLLIVGTGVVSYRMDREIRADAYKRLRRMALHDSLTALPNRSHFRDIVADLIAAAAGRTVALVAIDIDAFGAVNDQYGQTAGDAVLKEISARLRQALRDGEYCARLGGDEFAVAEATSEADGLDGLIARLKDVFARPIDADAFAGAISASFGVAVYPADAGDVEALINNAYLALHRAKAERGEPVRHYDHTMGDRVRARRQMAADLSAAIASGELQVHYQPQAAVRGGAIVGFEALARWPRAGGMAPPAEFIPIAEEYGIIDALGERVLRTACAEAAQWDPPYRVAVNLSATQLTSARLPQTVAAALRETGLQPSRLELELTESAIIRDARSSLRAMRQIRELGVTLALDDFGTGHSSLATLRTFPIDKIKLDRAFLLEIETSPQAKAVLRAVLALGAGLGIPVLTEGVETQGQLDMLREEGCSQAQGYWLGRPAAMSALVAEGKIRLKAPGTPLREAAA